jgi:hypothetical protein
MLCPAPSHPETICVPDLPYIRIHENCITYSPKLNDMVYTLLCRLPQSLTAICIGLSIVELIPQVDSEDELCLQLTIPSLLLLWIYYCHHISTLCQRLPMQGLPFPGAVGPDGRVETQYIIMQVFTLHLGRNVHKLTLAMFSQEMRSQELEKLCRVFYLEPVIRRKEAYLKSLQEFSANKDRWS